MPAAGKKMCLGWPAERQDHDKYVLVLLFVDPFRLPFRPDVEGGWSKSPHGIHDPTHRLMAWDCVACSLSARGKSAIMQPITFGCRDQNHDLRKHRMPRPACREGYGRGRVGGAGVPYSRRSRSRPLDPGKGGLLILVLLKTGGCHHHRIVNRGFLKMGLSVHRRLGDGSLR